MAREQPYPFPGAAGWGLVLGATVAYDWWAIKTGRPTMSRTLGHHLARPVLGPVLAGGLLGLAYHLLGEELLPAWAQQHGITVHAT